MFCSLLINLTVFASADSLIADEETAEIVSHECCEVAEPYAFVRFCTVEGCDGTVVTICMDECLYWGSSTHTPLFSDECHVNYFASRQFEYCSICKNFFKEIPAKVCFQVHNNCSLGPINDVCTGTHDPEVFENWWN